MLWCRPRCLSRRGAFSAEVILPPRCRCILNVMKTLYLKRELPKEWIDFSELGLNQIETIILNTLFDARGGELSTRIIAGEAEIPRQTANSILKSLTRRELIIEKELDRIPVFSTSAELIAKCISLKSEKLSQLKNSIENSEDF